MTGDARPVKALSAWSWSDTPSLRKAADGLINQTWMIWVRGHPASVLQRLNTHIFVPEVHEDIEAVTRHLEKKGLCTPILRRTSDGDLWHTDEEGGVWRVLSWVGDCTLHRLADPAQAREVGGLVGRFHRAMADFEWSFRSTRPGAHDTPTHLRRLEQALEQHRGHRLYEAVAPLAQELMNQWAAWRGPAGTAPIRVIHGDLKVSNLRFAGDRAVALIDLDTLAWGTIEAELGDALRSWCNTGGEDETGAVFNLQLFHAAMEGYAQASPELTEAEWASIVPGVERISLELAMRFAADALFESYFGFDARYGTRGDHNLLRAQGQRVLAGLVRDQRVEATGLLYRALEDAGIRAER